MASTYLTRTVSGVSTTEATFSAWIKRSALGEQCIYAIQSGNDEVRIQFTSGDQLQFYKHNGSSFDYRIVTDKLFRDTSAWYHIVCVFDSTESTASDRMKIYVNGVQETSLNNVTNPSSNDNSFWFQGATGYIGVEENGSSNPFSGIMSHLHMVQGTAYQASTFGSTDSTTGEWKINTAPSLTYGTNGFFILKDTNSGTDQSPNSNNWTVAGGTLTKTEDCPSNVFCTFNYTFGAGNQSSINSIGGAGGTQFSSGSTSSECFVVGNLAFSSGKYYWEWKAISEHPEANFWGVADIDQINSIGNGSIQLNNKSYVWAGSQGNKFNGSNGGSYGSQIDINNIGMVAVDMDNNKIWLGENGTWFASGNPATGANAMYSNLSGTITPFHCDDYSTYTPSAYYNFGNGYFGTTAVSSAGTNASGIGIFEYDVPTGYTALSTKGLNE